jgi:hypothetical protein
VKLFLLKTVKALAIKLRFDNRKRDNLLLLPLSFRLGRRATVQKVLDSKKVYLAQSVQPFYKLIGVL